MSTCKLEELFSGNPDEWISALQPYQKNIINTLLDSGKSPEEISIQWLSASGPANTFPFGAAGKEQGSSLFYEKLKEEVEAFFCEQAKYEEDRKKLLEQFNAGHTYIIGLISVKISPIVGTSSAFIAPIIALILFTIARIGLNAWCATLRAKNETQ
ncbi:conserved hypothetical protein [Desulforamulus reducens MI-1]|uniref:Uncharacterized protein n=1 Tax=Desulforamulus reducens (strain ATCC BAA-1160 / DSM 100696 / MI-1) TaxID=349161 RepID=A4J8X8_DESRM|nr:hypothetical protein [Desulforamulus reducens]ABO51531.1 conserved hypothetical protein [Desulforamulus reducens MI-1]